MPTRLQLALALLCAAPCLHAQTADVTAQLHLAVAHQSAHAPALKDVVLWLTPADPSTPNPPNPQPNPQPKTGYRLVQQNKMFSPHLLVVPTGSSVDFPNLDPYFHNVFSLFNGKRFDLGLYESGTHRAVRFDSEGVSYIFCNIHPEMGAVVLALSTPLYAVSTSTGAIAIHNVPPGRYRLHLWSEHYQSPAADRIVQVTAHGANLGVIDLAEAPDHLNHHTNKFGEEYPPPPHTPYP